MIDALTLLLAEIVLPSNTGGFIINTSLQEPMIIVLYLHIFDTISYSFQNLSLEFIPKISAQSDIRITYILSKKERVYLIYQADHVQCGECDDCSAIVDDGSC